MEHIFCEENNFRIDTESKNIDAKIIIPLIELRNIHDLFWPINHEWPRCTQKQ